MHLKDDVELFEEDGLKLKCGETIISISSGDSYIIKRLQNNVLNDQKILSLVKEREGLNDIDAEFRMAEFMEKYGQWIAIDDNVIPV